MCALDQGRTIGIIPDIELGNSLALGPKGAKGRSHYSLEGTHVFFR